MALHIKNKFARFDPGPDMTKGSIIAHLIWFSLPLLAGNLFQQLYNTVDAWVVGNFVSNEAFSAVGTVGPIINMLIGFFLGFSSGAGIVISQYYGARRYDKVHDTVHTAIVMTLVLAVILSIVGILLIPLMLDLMKTPEEVVPESTKYLTIYFAGMVGLMLYNMGSGILRAVGDSKRPFYFLVVSAVINTVLDLLFVCVFGMGVEGVAYATIIAQGVSAFLVILSLLKSDTCVVLHFRDLRIHPQMLAKIVKIGIPSAIQPAITGFSNVFVQSYINSFGAGLAWRLDGLFQNRPVCAAAHAVDFHCKHNVCRSEPRRRQCQACQKGYFLCACHVLSLDLHHYASTVGVCAEYGGIL